jgi:hypothetical protein
LASDARLALRAQRRKQGILSGIERLCGWLRDFRGALTI